ncbi:MAG: acyltransferase [Actinobacteria bacterium]|nr:acyltransferase [Actinomycetota bacterium]
MTSTPAAVVVPRRYGALDGMRALAAYGVLATHAGFNSGRSLDSGPFAPLLARLDFGVTVFFLLSGFLLYRPFAVAAVTGSRPPDVRRFYLRRALRILPAYWLAVLVTLSWLSARTADGGDWASYLLLVQTYNHHNLDPSLTQMWTLAVEISFYAVLPPLALAARGRRRDAGSAAARQAALLLALIGVAVAADVAAHHGRLGGNESLIWLPANLDWFAAGMALALLSCLPAGSAGRAGPASRIGSVLDRTARLGRDLAAAPGTCWALGGLLFWLASLPLAGPRNLLVPTGWEWTAKHWLYAVAALALLLPLTLGSGGLIGRLLSSAPLRLLGQLSYGVYLWHLPLLLAIQRGLGQHTFGGHFLELFVLTGLAATAVAALSWFGMERPLLRLGSPRSRGGGTGSQQPAAATSSASPQPS